MLPIPVPIVGSHRRLFIPLIYLAGTASFCYVFLIALVKVSPNHFHKKETTSATTLQSSDRGNQGHFVLNKNSNFLELRRRKIFEKFKREIDTDLFFDAYPEQRKKSHVLTTEFKSTKKKKHFLTTITPNTTTITQNNGARRSNPTQIRSRDQDLNLIDLSAPSVQPWPQDEQCSHHKINFAYKGTFKPRALVSFPGSGNSWIRYLIECSTGIFTGSVFHDAKIHSEGLLGELRIPNDGSTIVQKTHHDSLRFSKSERVAYVKLSEIMFGYRGILLIRNPFDALISYWHFIETHGDHREHARKRNFNPFKWKNFVLTLIPKWTQMIMSWVEGSQSLLIVQYEKVKKNPRQEIIRILDYLKIPVDEDRLSCLLRTNHLEGQFHRSHKNIKNKNQNSFPQDNPFEMMVQTEKAQMIEKGKNLVQVPGQNSKSWKRNDLEHLEQNSSHLLSSSLDLIVQDNIKQINRFFSDKYIPIFLNYRGPTTCCSH